MKLRPVLLPVALVTVALLSSCARQSRYSQRHDSGPARHIDVSRVADAVPREEPRSRYGNPDSYVVLGKQYRTLASSKGYVARGTASWYGTKFHGHRTSSGETYDMYAMTAAHKTLPLPTYARVTNLDNGRSVIVKINDRGPFHDNRLIDLSYAAASKLDIMKHGTGRVEVRAINANQQLQQATQAAPDTHKQRLTTLPASTTVTTTPDRTQAIYLQLGAFADAANARRLQQKLTTSNFQGVHILEATSKQQHVYRVRIGPLADQESARTLATMLKQHGVVSPSVIID